MDGSSDGFLLLYSDFVVCWGIGDGEERKKERAGHRAGRGGNFWTCALVMASRSLIGGTSPPYKLLVLPLSLLCITAQEPPHVCCPSHCSSTMDRRLSRPSSCRTRRLWLQKVSNTSQMIGTAGLSGDFGMAIYFTPPRALPLIQLPERDSLTWPPGQCWITHMKFSVI